MNDMPRWNTDNLITHICAAALIVDNFEVDVSDIRNDLKLENRESVPSSRPLAHGSPTNIPP